MQNGQVRIGGYALLRADCERAIRRFDLQLNLAGLLRAGYRTTCQERKRCNCLLPMHMWFPFTPWTQSIQDLRKESEEHFQRGIHWVIGLRVNAVQEACFSPK
jgi:hypothetical protein